MSRFEGTGIKVRCIDCTKLSEKGNECTVKKTKVAHKKRRLCTLYEFKDSFSNRKPLDSIYLPPVDNKTMKMIKKLMKMGVMPVPGDKDPGAVSKQLESFQMPKTTATASVPGLTDMDTNTLASPEDSAMSPPSGDNLVDGEE